MNMNISAILLTVTLGVISCSSSVKFDADGEKVLKYLKDARYYPPTGQDFLEVKLVKTITAEDSLNIILSNESLLNKIITDYNRTLESIKYNIANPSDLNYSVEESITEINRYADAFDGKFDDVEWDRLFAYKYFFKNLYRYRTAQKDQVLVKVYRIRYTKKLYDDREAVEKTDYFLMKPNLEGNYEGKKGVEVTNAIPKSNFDIEKLHFKQFVRE